MLTSADIPTAAMNESNPGLNIGDEAVDSVEGAFRRVREVLLGSFRLLFQVVPDQH